MKGKRNAWVASDPDRWREATEGYVSPIPSGGRFYSKSQRRSFAIYEAAMHNRIYPIFGDAFLNALGDRPCNDPLNDLSLFAVVDIILSGVWANRPAWVRKSSGQKEFDIGVLDSIDRAAPFGRPPEDIKSRDGNVYFTWGFYRNPSYACSTMSARPPGWRCPCSPGQRPTPVAMGIAEAGIAIAMHSFSRCCTERRTIATPPSCREHGAGQRALCFGSYAR